MNMHSDKKAWIKKCWQKTLSFLVKVEPILLFSIIAAFALLIRYSMFAVPSRDYEIFLSKWIEEIRTLGVKGAMGAEIGDYTPAYFYILVLLAYLPVPTLYSIKAVSCVFDVVMAVFVCLCVRELTKNKTLGFLSYCVTLLLPTVFFNSGMWAQCDIYGVLRDECIFPFERKKDHGGDFIRRGVFLEIAGNLFRTAVCRFVFQTKNSFMVALACHRRVFSVLYSLLGVRQKSFVLNHRLFCASGGIYEHYFERADVCSVVWRYVGGTGAWRVERLHLFSVCGDGDRGLSVCA